MSLPDDNDLLRDGKLPVDPSEGLVEVGAEDQWPEPIPLRSHLQLPTFPLDTLPASLAEWAAATADELQCPVELPACLALGSLSCACGGWLEVQVRENWTEPVNLFLAVALRSGEKKTPAYRRAIRPIRDFERDEKVRLSPILADVESEKAFLEARIKKIKGMLKSDKGVGPEELKSDLAKHIVELQQLPVAFAPRFLAEDITQEGLGVLMQANAERLGLFSDEGGIFRLMVGYYNDGKANLDIFLKSYSGETVTVDRITREPVRLERPSLTICLAVQPAVIESLGESPQLRDFGMLARFLLCIPTSLVGQRNHRAPAAPQDVLDQYDRHVASLLKKSRLTEALEPPATRLLSIDLAGFEELIEAQQEIEPRIGEGGDLYPYADWMNKCAGRIIRIAALIHAYREVDDGVECNTIPVQTIKDARRLHNFFLDHAVAGLDRLGADPAVGAAEHLLAWMKRRKKSEFKKRDAHSECRSLFSRSGHLDAPLALLVEKGWIRLLETPGPRSPGRPSESYLVHPAQKARKPQKGVPESGSVTSVGSVQGFAGNDPRTGEVNA
jgi:Protein of unknown function (DUF3987)